MLLETSIQSHYAPWSGFRRLFIEDAPVADDQTLLILDVLTKNTDAGNELHIILPPHVVLEEFSKFAKFYDANNQPLSAEYALFCRGSIARIQLPSAQSTIRCEINGTSWTLRPSKNDPSFFENKNTALLFSQRDDLETLSTWIKFHQKEHGLQAVALIRARPWKNTEPNFPQKLQRAIGDLAVDIMVLYTSAPLGKKAAAAHTLWEAPDAPGKERMDEPPIDYWRSELGSAQIFEILRARYLNSARAVLNLAPSDLIRAVDQKSIFDRCCESPNGYVQLFGERVFPWRIRKKEKPSFGVHSTHRFDSNERNRSWCVKPDGKKSHQIWNLNRVGHAEEFKDDYQNFWRFMGLRHEDRDDFNPTLAPKTSLVLYPELVDFVEREFGASPVLPPEIDNTQINPVPASHSGRRLIVTTMKNEGPFLLEWIAYHRAIGFDDFLIYTNDCTDGTSEFLDLLAQKGMVQHLDNPFRKVDLKPQHAAFFDARERKIVQDADWIICMDCDEYINIKTGDGTLDALFKAVGDANMISLTWRLFGNSDVVEFEDKPIIEQFNQCANEVTRFPHQAWGVKTLYRNLGYFKKLGVHRPKGLKPEYREYINWVNGSGKELPDQFIRNGWRTGLATVGYDLVQLNHYACRSMESFLVKRDRGRVNHVDRDQGMKYWFRMNHNPDEDTSIHRMLPKFYEEFEKLLADPEIKAHHENSVKLHRKRIEELMQEEDYKAFFDEINSSRMREISRDLPYFGMNVFLIGPDCVSDDILEKIRKGELEYFNPSAKYVSDNVHD